MNLSVIGNGLSRLIGRTGLRVQKYSPELLLVGGIVGFVGTAVMVYKATRKVDEVMDEHHAGLQKIDDCWEKVKEGDIPLDDYSEQDKRKDITTTYAQTGLKLLRLYGPSIALGTLSIVSLIAGYRVMKARNVAITAAFTAVSEAYSRYRRRVVEDQGEAKDYEYRTGMKCEEMEVVEVDEKGKVKSVKKVQAVSISPENLWYEEGTSHEWSPDVEYNWMTLKAKEKMLNNRLEIKGHVFMNEGMDILGLPRIPEGQIFGWKVGTNNVVDFGLFEHPSYKRLPRPYATIPDKNNSFLITFNLTKDDLIYDLI